LLLLDASVDTKRSCMPNDGHAAQQRTGTLRYAAAALPMNIMTSTA
jgi:hypothetical protein